MVHEQQKILCALRSEQMSLSGLWEFPGGKIEPGETSEQALAREIHEELGCTIEVGDFVVTCTHEYLNVCVQLDTYYAEIIYGTPVAKEHQKLEWVNTDALQKLEWAPADMPTVQTLMKK
ncbi:(deoxy)nucleoside triphosphate pyrophosphohydrolase [Alicyclobacillus mengziensis]|uniref:8-oxo-dGTP diphosphatase n=2 Tax=Alicyclobacillus mengziensis TaxID=2931921 RepID=A0A9X7W4L7_9BACL|nr:(deoxy)nucleoside triphosphate pyrophosphohydrolase [Alicyclobacillus mengziensis]